MSHRKLLVTLLTLLVLSVAIVSPTQAQTDNLAEMKHRAGELVKANKFTEALPILEKLAAAEPNDGETQFFLAFALLGQAKNTKDDAARKSLRLLPLSDSLWHLTKTFHPNQSHLPANSVSARPASARYNSTTLH